MNEFDVTENGFQLSVPGKCMIAGEYSVLMPGGMSVAFAVAPGLVFDAKVSDRWTLYREDLGLRWTEGMAVPAELLFAHAALYQGIESLNEAVMPIEIQIRPETRGMSGRGKAGLGGSAAVVVGIVSALSVVARGSIDTPWVIQTGVAAHEAAHGGKGSGYDVATIATGGVTAWIPDTSDAEALSWPSGLHCVSGYSGKSAHTPTLIRASERALGLDSMRIAANDAINAFRSGSTKKVLSAIEHCQQAFMEWDEGNQLGLWTHELATLDQIAQHEGALTRVSGAGGGDTLLAFTDDVQIRDRVVDGWTHAGFDTALRIPSETGPSIL